jgi:hypothetical protein
VGAVVVAMFLSGRPAPEPAPDVRVAEPAVEAPSTS